MPAQSHCFGSLKSGQELYQWNAITWVEFRLSDRPHEELLADASLEDFQIRRHDPLHLYVK